MHACNLCLPQFKKKLLSNCRLLNINTRVALNVFTSIFLYSSFLLSSMKLLLWTKSFGVVCKVPKENKQTNKQTNKQKKNIGDPKPEIRAPFPLCQKPITSIQKGKSRTTMDIPFPSSRTVGSVKYSSLWSFTRNKRSCFRLWSFARESNLEQNFSGYTREYYTLPFVSFLCYYLNDMSLYIFIAYYLSLWKSSGITRKWPASKHALRTWKTVFDRRTWQCDWISHRKITVIAASSPQHIRTVIARSCYAVESLLNVSLLRSLMPLQYSPFVFVYEQAKRDLLTGFSQVLTTDTSHSPWLM